MKITPHCVVALTWTLKDSLGDMLDELDEPVEFLVGGDDLLAVIERHLMGKSAGDKVDVHIEPEEGFGEYEESLVFLEPRRLFPAELEEGHTIDGHALPAGTNAEAPRDALYTVTDLYPEHVVLDGNHPLAGISLNLSLRVRAVREATADEVGAGTAGTGFFRVQAAQDALPTPMSGHGHGHHHPDDHSHDHLHSDPHAYHHRSGSGGSGGKSHLH